MARRIWIGLALLVVILGVVWWFAMKAENPPTVVEATAHVAEEANGDKEPQAQPESERSEPSRSLERRALKKLRAAKKKPLAGSTAGSVHEKRPRFEVMSAPVPPTAEAILMSTAAAREPTEALEAAGPAEAVGQIIESLEAANIAFNAPQAMVMRETTTIQLALSMEHSIEELKDQITAAGEKEGHQTAVSNRMEARLTGAGFSITAITPEEQAISSRGTTTWSWDVEPTRPGVQSLHLSLTALIDVENHSTQRTIKTFDKKIDVNVTWQQQAWRFVTSNWQWLWAALLVPGAGWLWRRRQKAEP